MTNVTIRLFATAIALSVSSAAFAQTASKSDSDYCVALSHLYDKYVNDPNGRHPDATPADVGTAKGKCTSDPASGIPVLEKALTDKKISLPARG